MAGKNTAAFGIFANRAAAEAAVDQLSSAGFSHSDVSVLMSDKAGSQDFATEKNTKAPEGTTTGVGVGGVLGGALGLMAGLGALAIPGVGPLIAAGPIMGALAGLGVGGAVGGLVGALVGLGIPEYEAKRYEGRVNDGGILVSVHCESSEEVSRAKDVLRRAGGEDVASSGEKAVSSHTANTDRDYERTGTVGSGVANDFRTTSDGSVARLDETEPYRTSTTRSLADREDVIVNDRKPVISTPE